MGQASLFEPAVLAADPLRFPCTYPGLRGYFPPCRAKPGEPCRWANPPFNRFHPERRVAAGEKLPTYEELTAAKCAARPLFVDGDDADE